ncbi:FkbM family methyltransferase [Brucella sp. BE17]|uniref:FkbM family methyltransferase n=1 Tax=Brucella sp. BE17 TaxID=3142977 RepID=UPI0031BA48E0
MDRQKNFKSEDVVRLTEGGLSYRIYLPNREDDYIQKYIFEKKTPYEKDMLVSMCSYLQEEDIVLDVGANVGNHTLYLAGVGQARVFSFEPNRHLADAIRRSVELSGFENTVSVFNFGLGRVSGRAHFEKDLPDNLGAQKLQLGEGELEVARLDDQEIPAPVKMIKIDVEGMELDVLQGGRNLILRDQPILYIESATEANYRQISNYLAELGYGYWEGFNATPTHCFRPRVSLSLNEQVERLIQKEVFQEYRLREQLRSAYRAQNEALAKGKALEEQVDALAANLEDSNSKLLVANENVAELKGGLIKSEAMQRAEINNLKKQLAVFTAYEDTTPYLLSKRIIEAGTSLSGFLRLPFAVMALAARGVSRRLSVQKSQSKRSLGNKAKDRLIREVKARPALERPARKALNWWRARNGSNIGQVDTRQSSSKAASLPFASEIKVATILDEFSFGSFACEFNAVPVDPDNWRERFEAEKPDIFFCESAWSGPDSKQRSWKGQIYASVNFKKENREALLSIIEYCKSKGIPTVFWNKEDPTHFDDKVHDFIKSAQLFDFVFTSAAECVERYKQEYGCKSVFALPFATQPRLFNPIEPEDGRTKDIVFAGSWYAIHKERSKLMEQVLGRFLDDGYALKIFDRHYGTDDPNHIFPDRFRPYLLPPVSHKELDEVYKSSIFGLNFNTVTDSETMFARRIFELMSSNTLVLSNYSIGVDHMLRDDVVFVDRDPSRLKSLSVQEVDAIRARALQNVLERHTYEKRWEFILDSIGFRYRKNDQSTTLVVRINNRDEARQALDYFSKFEAAFADAKLLLLLSKEMANISVADYYRDFNRYGHEVVSEHYLETYQAPLERILSTRNMLFVPMRNFPPLEWVKNALLHLVYADNRYISYDPDQEAYREVLLDNNKPLLSSASGFASLMGQKIPDRWNSVFYV